MPFEHTTISIKLWEIILCNALHRIEDLFCPWARCIMASVCVG